MSDFGNIECWVDHTQNYIFRFTYKLADIYIYMTLYQITITLSYKYVICLSSFLLMYNIVLLLRLSFKYFVQYKISKSQSCCGGAGVLSSYEQRHYKNKQPSSYVRKKWTWRVFGGMFGSKESIWVSNHESLAIGLVSKSLFMLCVISWHNCFHNVPDAFRQMRWKSMIL